MEHHQALAATNKFILIIAAVRLATAATRDLLAIANIALSVSVCPSVSMSVRSHI